MNINNNLHIQNFNNDESISITKIELEKTKQENQDLRKIFVMFRDYIRLMEERKPIPVSFIKQQIEDISKKYSI